MFSIPIKYFDREMPKIEHIGGNMRSNWIDLRVRAVEVNGNPVEWGLDGRIAYKASDEVKVYLGIAMQLPEGNEAHIVPRSSTYKNFKLILVDSMGIVDEIYYGDNDEWFAPMLALADGEISRFDRVVQFRIMGKMSDVEFMEVGRLDNPDRGGHGSSGVA